MVGAIANQVNNKTEIYRQLVGTQNIDLAELYHEAYHILLLAIAPSVKSESTVEKQVLEQYRLLNTFYSPELRLPSPQPSGT